MVTEKKIAELDAKFEQVIDRAHRQVSDTEFTQPKSMRRRKRAADSDLDFCTIYFPRIFDSPFNDLHKEVATWKAGNYTLSGSRLFGKSAFVYVGKVIKHIAEGRGGIVNISLYDETLSKQRTSSISRIIKNNKLLCYDYNIELVQDLSGYHIFKSDGGQTTLVATSVRQGLRSFTDDEFKRFTLSVADDLYSRQTLSELMIEKVVNFVVSEQWGQMEPGGLSITISNAIIEDAPIVELREKYTKPAGRHYGLAAMNTDETESNWPERYDLEYLHNKRDGLPYDVWMGDYMDQPVEVGEVLDPEWIRFVNLNLINILASISVADPSHGESPAACDKGLATIGIDDRQKVHVQDIYLRKEGYTLFFDYCHHIRQSIDNYKVLLFENDFSQWNFADPWYQQWLADRKTPLPIVPFLSKELITEHRGSDKEGRIMNLVHPHQTGQIDYSEQLKNNPDFLRYKNKNYMRFGKHKKTKLDGLDALASAYILIWSYIETGAFKQLKQKKWTADKMKSWFR